MELEDKFLETLQVIKGIADSIKRDAQQKNNSKVQEQLKELIQGFKDELEKGNASRSELANKLNETKNLETEKSQRKNMDYSSIPDEKYLKNLSSERYRDTVIQSVGYHEQRNNIPKEERLTKGTEIEKNVFSFEIADGVKYEKIENEFKKLYDQKELSKLDKYLFEKLEDVKTKAEKLAKDNNISWAICKEFKPKHSRDSIKSTLDLLIDKAKDKVEQQDRNNSKEKVKAIEPKEKTKTKSR